MYKLYSHSYVSPDLILTQEETSQLQLIPSDSLYEIFIEKWKQRIEVSFLRNQLIKSSRFNNRTIFQSDNTIVLFEQTFIQRVGNIQSPSFSYQSPMFSLIFLTRHQQIGITSCYNNVYFAYRPALDNFIIFSFCIFSIVCLAC